MSLRSNLLFLEEQITAVKYVVEKGTFVRKLHYFNLACKAKSSFHGHTKLVALASRTFVTANNSSS